MTKKSDPIKITQICINILNHIYEKISEEKKTLLNHPCIMKYLFDQPIITRDNIIEAHNSIIHDSLPIVKLTSIARTSIEMSFLTLYQLSIDYYKKYTELSTKLSQKYDIKLEKYIVTPKPRINTATRKIMKVLNESNIDYIPNFSFKLLDQHTNICQKKPYIFKSELDINILGYIRADINKISQRLVLFAIIFDTATTTSDIMRQYIKHFILRKMNIHLLRLNDESNIKKEVTAFIKMVHISQKYLGINTVKYNLLGKKYMTADTLKSSVMLKSLHKFYDDYIYNHNLYLNYHYDYDNEPEILIDNGEKTINKKKRKDESNDDEPGDTSVVMTTDIFKKMAHSNILLSDWANQQANKIK